MADILGSGVGFPLGADRRGRLALARGEEDVAQAIRVILQTAPGERPMRPEFGCRVHDHVFANVDAYTIGRIEHEIRVALARWEPRIDVLDLGFDLSRAADGALSIDIRYLLRATNNVRNLVYPFYIIPAEEPA
jgi:phage baseplate assembly protein W